VRAAIVFAFLVACGYSPTKDNPNMTDHKRLVELEHSKGTMQYGQNLQVTPAVGADLVQASKDLIRFVGDKTDINALRIYLGPWQPKPDINIPPIITTAEYANPTPWAPPEPRTFDSFAPIPVYARIMWGAGGIQHTAYVDWPRRGLLLQVSGSYVQVNAFVNTESTNAHVPSEITRLPLLAATIGPEPGGGDAANPATFTYPKDTNAQDDGGAGWFQNFQIPPFARAFIPNVDFATLVAVGGTLKIATQEVPAPIGTIGFNDIQVWTTPIAGAYDQELFTSTPIPISGQECGNLRIESTPGTSIANFGVAFLLDL
jgi:hypothetical protein